MPNPNVDLIATKLHEWGSMAARMPPAWDGAGISQPIAGFDRGEQLGRMLPGRGLYLDCDLKSLGINRPVPLVYERTRVQRAVDKIQKLRRNIKRILRDEQGAIASYDGIINARAGGNAEDRTFFKNSQTSVANSWTSLWQAGGMPVAGTFSATPGVAPNNATTGALSFGLSTPGSGSKYLLTLGFTSTSAINMMLMVDLLSQLGTLSATTNAAQNVASQALTRYTSGAGVMMNFEVTTQIGTTASNLTALYTNQAGTAGQSTGAQAMTTSMIVLRVFPNGTAPFTTLATGDFGVRQLTRVTLSAAMTAGVFGANLYYPLMWVPGIVANIYVERDSTVQIDGITQLVIGSDSAIGCLGAFVQTNTTSTGLLVGFMRTCSG